WKSRPGGLSRGQKFPGGTQGIQGGKDSFPNPKARRQGQGMPGNLGQGHGGIASPQLSVGILFGKELYGQSHGGPSQHGGGQVIIVPAIYALPGIHSLFGYP